MRPNIKNFARIVSRTLPISEPIYEFGSLQVRGQVRFADLRPVFKNREYIGCDMREGPGVDKVLNLHDIDLPSESIGMVLCFETLEHVENPRKALAEIHRILKPDGIAVISSLMNFPIHDHPYDYWRFTPEAFKSILKPFSNSFVGFQGEESFPHTVVGVGFKGNRPSLTEFEEEYIVWQKKNNTKQLKFLILDLIPPIVHPLIAKLYRIITRSTKRAT